MDGWMDKWMNSRKGEWKNTLAFILHQCCLYPCTIITNSIIINTLAWVFVFTGEGALAERVEVIFLVSHGIYTKSYRLSAPPNSR
jgi:uncharacterized protein (DUF486 family)